MLKVERKEKGAVTVLYVSGEIDDTDVNILRLAIMACIQEQRYHLVLNFEKVVLLGYLGVGVLMERLSQLHALGGDIKLACLNLQAWRQLGMMGLSHVLECFETESAAIQGYKKEAA